MWPPAWLWIIVQGEAIAVNLREMFGLRVPILSVVIGEGGSGGALAIGCANRNLIMEHSVYYVASPEACAAILWKARDKAATVSCVLTLPCCCASRSLQTCLQTASCSFLAYVPTYVSQLLCPMVFGDITILTHCPLGVL